MFPKLMLSLLGVLLVILPSGHSAPITPVEIACDWRQALLGTQPQGANIGYLTAFMGLNMAEYLKPDIQVIDPLNNKVVVTGVIESISWKGNPTDPISISAYISAENAHMLMGKLKTLDTTKVTSLNFVIYQYDGSKVYYPAFAPSDGTSLKGQLNAPSGGAPRITLASTATKVAPNIDLNVYSLYFEIVPVPTTNLPPTLRISTGPKQFIKQPWGTSVKVSQVTNR